MRSGSRSNKNIIAAFSGSDLAHVETVLEWLSNADFEVDHFLQVYIHAKSNVMLILRIFLIVAIPSITAQMQW